jgi:hypothetical protein
MKIKNYHFGVMGDKIVCWNGNDDWTVIANIVIKRSCKHLVRYANAGEDMEELCDKLIGDTMGTDVAKCFEPKD